MCFPLVKKKFELKFSAMDTAYCSTMQVHLAHCVARARFDTIHKRESTSYSVNLFREMFQVVYIIITKSFHFVSVILRVRALVLTHAPSFVQRHDYAALKFLSIDSKLQRSCKSGSPRSVHSDSIIHAKTGLSCSQMSAIRLSSTNIAL